MSAVKAELIQLVEAVACDIPLIKQVYMPEPKPSPDKDSEFGIVVLDDDSCGLYYAWMGEAQTGMNERYADRDFAGMNPLELMQYFNSEHEADRSLGLAAINAVSQSIFRRANFPLDTASNSMGELDIRENDHVGMIGFFPSLVRRLREQNIRVTVIEKKLHLVQSDELVNVSLDASELLSCNKILSTASTLLNNSVDEILEYTKSAEVVVVVGPTAGFFPDPLFKRGVSAVGGSMIVDVELAISRLSSEQGLGDAARKYLIKKTNYPGAGKLFLD
jgi:uncharacterized protein (DUF4213/DUF364 family)